MGGEAVAPVLAIPEHEEDQGAWVLLEVAADDLPAHQGLAESGGQGQEGAEGLPQFGLDRVSGAHLESAEAARPLGGRVAGPSP